MLDEGDKNWITEKIGDLIRKRLSAIDSRTRWHSSDIVDLKIGSREHDEQLDRIEAAIEKLVAANNTNAEIVAALSGKIDQLVEALLHPAGNGTQRSG